jgi:hypothetical protein
MFDNAQVHYPADLARAAQQPSLGLIESTAWELLDSLEAYAREKPASAALWALGIGFFLGWKLKPW